MARVKSQAGRVYRSYWDLGLGDTMSKNKLSNCIKLIFVTAIASTLFSCRSQSVNLETLDPNLFDQSWLTEKPCGAPCWYGLEPGVSSRDDSISKVKQLPFIDENTVSPYQDEVGFQYKKPLDSNSVDLFFKKGILDEIIFPLGYRVTFEQAVEKLGSPDGYEIWLTPGGLYFGCRLDVIWENKRLMLEYSTGDISIISFGPNTNRDLCNNTGKQPLPKGLLVDSVYITSPSIIKSMMDYFPWKGFEN